MEQDTAAFVAMDTHKEMIAVAVAEAARSGEVRFVGEIPNRADAVRRLLDKLASKYNLCHSPNGEKRRVPAPCTVAWMPRYGGVHPALLIQGAHPCYLQIGLLRI